MQVGVKARIADGDASAVRNFRFPLGNQGGYGEAHSNPVVGMGMDEGAFQRGYPGGLSLNNHAVFGSGDGTAHSGEVLNHNINAVGFFDF